MKKFIAKFTVETWVALLLINVPLIIIGAIPIVLLCALLGLPIGNTFSIVYTVVICIIGAFFLPYIAFNISGGEKTWKECREKRLQIKASDMKPIFIVLLVTAVVFALAFFITYSSRNAHISNIFEIAKDKSNKDRGAQRLAGFVLRMATVMPLVTFISGLFCFRSMFGKKGYCYCKTCGCLQSYKVISKSDFHTETRTESKTKDTYGTIGTLYADGQKVGEVKGNTGTQTFTRDVSHSSWDETSKCIYCGETRTVRKGRTDKGQWRY